MRRRVGVRRMAQRVAGGLRFRGALLPGGLLPGGLLRGGLLRGGLLLGGLLLGAGSSRAQEARAQPSSLASSIPWGDVGPQVVGEHVEVAALGLVDPRIGSWPAQRASARRRAEERARKVLADWLDARLRGTSPSVATRAHAAARQALVVVAVRPLADGGAVVVMRAALSALRAPFDEGRAPL